MKRNHCRYARVILIEICRNGKKYTFIVALRPKDSILYKGPELFGVILSRYLSK